MNRFSFALIIPLAHQDFQQYQNTFALQWISLKFIFALIRVWHVQLSKDFLASATSWCAGHASQLGVNELTSNLNILPYTISPTLVLSFEALQGLATSQSMWNFPTAAFFSLDKQVPSLNLLSTDLFLRRSYCSLKGRASNFILPTLCSLLKKRDGPIHLWLRPLNTLLLE